MDLTNSERFFKLVSNLVTNYDLIPLYVKHNILSRKFPVDLQLPWWSYRAIGYVDTIVGEKQIFEYGTGGSTIRFAKKAKSIVSVEDDIDWGNMVQKRLKELAINNVQVIQAPFDFRNPKDFENSNYLKAVDKNIFDIIIIDGQDHTFQERIKCFTYTEPRMQPGQYIIVDDFWRYERLTNISKAKEIKIFESVGPCRYGVTSTAVFLY